MKEYQKDVPSVLSELSSGCDGLSSEEAARRLEQYGRNKLREGKKESLLHRLAMQFTDPMTIILIVAAVVSGITSAYQKEFPADVLIILFVVIVNAVLGVFQETKAEKAIEALRQMSAAKSKVIRGGKLQTVESEELVPGDIVVLEAGDSVPADCRIISCASLKTEESALTGESVPVEKQSEALKSEGDIALGDRSNMCYMGSAVVYGHGEAVVTATGMDTQMGRIAGAINDAKDGETPLQIKLNQLSKILSFLVLGICVVIFVLDIVRNVHAGNALTFDTMLDTFMIAVSLAVAAIPEGLATVVTIVLSIGVTKMSRKSAVIRRLTAVETLGCTQIICSDKTGTLTQNKMTVTDHYGGEKLVAQAMALCSDAVWQDGEAKGEPTEAALVAWAAKLGMPKGGLEDEFPRIAEAPFDSQRKMMSTVHAAGSGSVQYTKGAPDIVLSRCTHALVDGRQVPLTPQLRADIMLKNKEMADKALRVLAVAVRTYASRVSSISPEEAEQGLCFMGLAGMIDPVRPEAVAAIKQAKEAGIRPVMITGDHKDTAFAIARELGVASDPLQVITGAELDSMSDSELEHSIADYSVYARVQPEHKVRIVNAWRKNGMVTAMTGDGVNDAPSIKNADIGIGMGITGTDVTKNVADMVLADDNFATIVYAVEEGRRIYDNIRRSIQFLLSSNLSEVLTILIATLAGFVVLEPVHLLWINLITDSFPAMALGVEKAEPDIMRRPPRKSREGVFAGGMGVDVAWQGLMVTVVTLAAYYAGMHLAHGTADFVHQNGMTMAFLTLSLAEIFHAFNMRSRNESIFTLKSHNKLLYGAMALSLLLTTLVIYVPFLANAFDFAAISAVEYLISLLLAASVIPIVELVKLIKRSVKRKKNK